MEAILVGYGARLLSKVEPRFFGVHGAVATVQVGGPVAPVELVIRRHARRNEDQLQLRSGR